jgi:DmsE family decaheme c-type cytochrome
MSRLTHSGIVIAAFLSLLCPASLMAEEPKTDVVQPNAGTPHDAGAPPAAGLAEPGACAMCHDVEATALAATKHGRTKVANWDGITSCESCHGPGGAHVAAGGTKETILNPASLPATKVNAICLSCHERDARSHWTGSPHEQRGLACTSCHSIHHAASPATPLLIKKTEFETCTGCHLKRQASLYRSAHMPMREGKVTCTSCHNPHGSTGPAMLRQFSVNENCYSCHAERRAPMLWEHPPVKESCVNCHDPHGTLNPRLLIAKVPRLCQQCHDETRHPTQPYSDASSGSEFFPNSRMFDRGCVNCHSMIHGSNHPSGMRFLR